MDVQNKDREYKKDQEEDGDDEEHAQDTKPKDTWTEMKQYNANYDQNIPKDVKNEIENIVINHKWISSEEDMSPLAEKLIRKPKILKKVQQVRLL